jgi:DNA adenine methylase
MDEIIELLARYKSKVEVIPVEHRYSFGNQGHKVNDNRNAVQEYLFIGY